MLKSDRTYGQKETDFLEKRSADILQILGHVIEQLSTTTRTKGIIGEMFRSHKSCWNWGNIDQEWEIHNETSTESYDPE